MNPAKPYHLWTRLKRSFLVAAAAAGACFNVSAAIPVGGTAPNFTIKNHTTGQPLNLFDYQGCIVVLDFWAYWCGPCKSSAPDVETNIVQYYRNLGGNNHGVPVVVISISVDNGSPTSVQSYINAYGLELPADDTANAYNWYGDGYIPYFAVLNGTTNATNLQQWQVLYSASGYNRSAIRSAIDSVSVPPPVIGTSGNLSFGDVVTGATATATLTLANNGGAPLIISTIAYPAGFSGPWSGTISPGGSQNVTVTFAPLAVTAYGGTVTVNSNTTGGTHTILASGNGVVPPPSQATSPNPASGATDQYIGTCLSWANGGGATSYDVFLNGRFVGNQTTTTYNPGTLAYGTSYSWRVDPHNSTGVTTGDTWSFITGPALGAGDLLRTSDGTAVTIIAYTGAGGAVTIPHTINGRPVTRIESHAFLFCTGLTGVTFPASVTSIGDGAFQHCSSLGSASFAGNAPTMGAGVFDDAASGFTVHYFSSSAGFTTPTWLGYTAVSMGKATPSATWLVTNGLPYDADLQTDPNHNGVCLLMAYALNLDPNQCLNAAMPRAVTTGNQMSLTFYGGNSDVTYTVQTCTNLLDWSTNGIILSGPDANGMRIATVGTTESNRFMRLVVSH